MTDDIDVPAVTSTDEFETAMGKLIEAATANGVDPHGTFVYRSRGAVDWEVMVIELEGVDED